MSGQRQFGPYTLIRQIAVGGMAEIHLAKTEGLAGFEKYVAIKMIHPNFSQDETFIQMLIDEAKISVQLQHVNVAQTFDLGRVGDTYYITMEYVDGADLYKLLRRASEKDIDMPVDVAAFIAKEMANGLDYAHRRRGTDGKPLGIVHRDVSPQNVLISHAGEVKLVDFGIAKATSKVRQTAAGVIKGKYYYMSPEQAWGDPVDHRTDIFSAGILLYEALTGQMLYLEEDLNRLMDMVRKANIQSPRHLRRDIPPQLERIIMHALKKRREDRYQTAGDMASDLERFLHTYSPVFQPAKVSQFFHEVLDVDPPPPTAEMTAASPAPTVTAAGTAAGTASGTASSRIAITELMRERSEFSDENSVIFRVADMGKGQSPAGSQPRDGERATRPMSKLPDNQHVSFISDLDNIEEQTVISAPPGFDGATRIGGTPAFPSESDYEPTVIEISGEDTEDEDGPTTNRPAARRPAPPASRQAVAQGPRRPPVHPAMAAKTPVPAVSAVRPPRESRKTPTGGVAAQGLGNRSLISTLVGNTGDIPEPARPGSARPGEQPSGAKLPLQAPPITPIPGPFPGAPPGQAAGASPGSPPGLPPNSPPGSPPGLPPAVRQAPDPFSPLPQGMVPQTMTRQLQAMLELEEIPAHYKIARQRPRWLVRVGLVLVCVAGGVGLGMAMFAGQDDARPVVVEISSVPDGASVSVDGKPLPDKTPLLFNEATIGGRYELRFEREGYVPLVKNVLVNDHDERVLVVLDRKLETVVLVVESQPEGAEIIVGGKKYGRAPKRIPGLDPKQATTLELVLPGYKPHREDLDWSQEITLERRVSLDKK